MKKAVPFICIFVLVCIFFFPFFLQGKLPVPSDTIVGLYHPFRDLYAKDYPNGMPYKNSLITDPVRQQIPWKFIAIEQIKNGELPLWNPYAMAGFPLLGTLQSGVFYPGNILFFFFPFQNAWGLFIFFQPVLAGWFVYLYLRNQKLSSVACFFSGFIFAFSGFFVSWMEWGNILHTGLWLPLILLSIDKLLSKQTKKNNLLWSFLFVFSLTSSFFAGHLQVFFYVALVSCIYFFIKWIQTGMSKKILGLFIILTGCFFLITAIQWIPTFQLIGQSARESDQSDWHKDGWFLPYHHLVQFIAPDFFGNPATLNYWGTWNYGEMTGYIGILSLLFVFVAIGFVRNKQTTFWGIVLLCSLIFALPTFLGKLPYILHLPFLSTAQPTRLLFLADFSLALLAGFGMDFLLRKQKLKPLFYSFLLLFVITGFVWMYLLFFSHISSENLAVAKRNMLLPTVFLSVFGASFFLLFLPMKKKVIFSVFIVLALLITLFDLFRFFQKFNAFTDRKYFFPNTKILSFLQKNAGQFRFMSTDPRIMTPNFSLMYHLQSADGYDPLFLLSYGELISANERVNHGIQPPFGFNRTVTPENINTRIIDVLSIKYVLSFTKLPAPRFVPLMQEGKTLLYQNTTALDRAFFVETILPVQSKDEAISALFNEKIDLKKTAVVFGFSGKQNVSSGKVRFVSYQANKVMLATENNDTGFLVLTDTFYPTWKAKVCSEKQTDCRETKIYKTDYQFRGITVPKGKKMIIFENDLL